MRNVLDRLPQREQSEAKELLRRRSANVMGRGGYDFPEAHWTLQIQSPS